MRSAQSLFWSRYLVPIFYGYLHSSLSDRSSIIGEHPSYVCFLLFLNSFFRSCIYYILVFYSVQATNLQFYCFAHYTTCDYDFASRKQTEESQLTARDRWLLFKHLNVPPLSFFLLRSWRNLFLDTVCVSTLSADASSERKTLQQCFYGKFIITKTKIDVTNFGRQHQLTGLFAK